MAAAAVARPLERKNSTTTDATKKKTRAELFAELEEIDFYKGPEEFLQAGNRGFLITTETNGEEKALDEAIRVLRQASIKAYGAKDRDSANRTDWTGFVKFDIGKHTEVSLYNSAGEIVDYEAWLVQEGEREDVKGPPKPEEEAKTETEAKPAETEENKATETTKKEPTRAEYPRFRGFYKFQAFRTELRNIMFIKSNVPDPGKITETLYEALCGGYKANMECINQLVPVHGVCNYDMHELEVMCRRIVTPMLESKDTESKTFGILLFDPMSEPGADMLIEAVRNAIWGVNPLATQASPLTNPDVTVRLEVVGSKLVLSCLPNFMKYREYAPIHVKVLGEGEGEDDDGTYRYSEKFNFDGRSHGHDRGRDRGRDNKDRERKRSRDRKDKGKDESKPKDKKEEEGEDGDEGDPGRKKRKTETGQGVVVESREGESAMAEDAEDDDASGSRKRTHSGSRTNKQKGNEEENAE